MRYFTLMVVGLAVTAVPAVGMADETKAPAPAREADDSGFVEVEAEELELESAGAINFQAALDLPVGSLLDLGGRIERARYADDPIELATAAHLLAAAEKASGRQAPLTAEHLRQEAISRAKDRREPAELAMVAALIGDEETTRELQELAALSQSEIEDAEAAAEAGEEERHVRRLLVRNESNRRGYVVRVGWGPNAQSRYVHPGGRVMFHDVRGTVRARPTGGSGGGREQHFRLPDHADFYRVTLRGGWSGGGWGGN